MAEEDELQQALNRFGRRAGFGRGVTPAIRNVPKDVRARFDARDMQALIRDVRGRFIERGLATQALAAAHREMAISAGEFMVRAFDTAQRAVGRPQNRPGHLRKAIRDPGNRIATPTGWGIGLPEHYDRSPASRYWRFIEFGGENPMNEVAGKGKLIAKFWHPFAAAPGAAPYRSQGRLAWKYAVGGSDTRSAVPRADARFREARKHPGAVLGVSEDDKDDYTRVGYPVPRIVDGTVVGTRTLYLYFRKERRSGIAGRFAAFDGYEFHALGGQRFLNARTPSEVYRRVFAQYGLAVDVT